MSIAMQKHQLNQLADVQRQSLEVRVALNQNLWGMPDDQVWQYYRLMCQHLKLDPASKPFDIITDSKVQQKKLYANTSCSSQLGDNARLSYGKLEIDVNQGLVALGFKVAHVWLEARHPNGRTLVSEAFVDLMSGYEGQPLKGNNLVNALKKAGTQCRRRATLQMLGLTASSEEIPMIKLGDMERSESDAEGVIIEHPPAAALEAPRTDYDHDMPTIDQQQGRFEQPTGLFPEPEVSMTRAEILQAEIRELCEAREDSGQIAKEINRQLKAFEVERIANLTEEQLPKLKEGLERWIKMQRKK